MRRLLGFAIVLIAVFATGSANAAAIVPTELNHGDPYHLAFVTQGTRSAVSNLIADYNQFVTEEAALNPSATGTDIGVQWFAMASTASPRIDALSNVLLAPVVPSI